MSRRIRTIGFSVAILVVALVGMAGSRPEPSVRLDGDFVAPVSMSNQSTDAPWTAVYAAEGQLQGTTGAFGMTFDVPERASMSWIPELNRVSLSAVGENYGMGLSFDITSIDAAQLAGLLLTSPLPDGTMTYSLRFEEPLSFLGSAPAEPETVVANDGAYQVSFERESSTAWLWSIDRVDEFAQSDDTLKSASIRMSVDHAAVPWDVITLDISGIDDGGEIAGTVRLIRT